MNVIRRLLLVINLFVWGFIAISGAIREDIFSSATIGSIVAWYVIYQVIFYVTTGKLNRDFLTNLITRD